nr:vegetative incompatibility protein het-e-1 [Quercus suber]
MRLLNIDTLTFTDFFVAQALPPYVIASHRWVAGTEAMLEDVQQQKDTSKAGYHKVKRFAKYVKAQIPLVKWLWIDTCCIDQKSSQEVGEAINSMFRWYRDAEVCLAYLGDVTATNEPSSFEKSVWFKRGWTLQELLAPSVVIFLSKEWEVIGHKGRSGYGRSGIPVRTGVSLESRVAVITKIPEAILQDYEKSEGLSSDEKTRWMADRDTTRGEDSSYCLLGILGVSMNIRYGDGREKTRIRLMEKVSKSKKLLAGIKQDKYHVPFSRKGIPFTDFFVPREADMQHLTSFFQSAMTAQRQRVFVVHGMGGTGKTQLCAEFARTHREQFSAVFWLDGSSRDALKRSLVSAASRLPVNAGQQSAEGLSASVDSIQLSESFLQWLSLSDNKDWLLIIDNVDRDWQPQMEDPQAYDYREFLPDADHGSILVTTRLARLRRPNASLGLASVEDRVAREMVELRAGRQIPGKCTTPIYRCSGDD